MTEEAKNLGCLICVTGSGHVMSDDFSKHSCI